MSKWELTRSDTRALIALVIILLTGLIIYGLFRISPSQGNEPQSLCDSAEVIAVHWDTIVKNKQPKDFQKSKRADNNHELTPFPFDPNTADSATLAKLGLPHWMARRIVRYREAGGKFRNKTDLKKIYGMRADDYQKLIPYIIIKPDTLISRKQKENIQLDLNETDSATLTKVPNIGQYRAHQIIRYRERLGGYANVEQLMEIKGMPEDIKKWFYVKEDFKVKPLAINKSKFKELLRHPYLNYNQVKAIMNHRSMFGPIEDLKQLSNDTSFTDSDIERLKRYVILKP